mmetsp:Transcript_39317/g.77345  ORF Transcript_39317/g.77345 Transcript_39317/m.77345 type:complete len:109 (-) Transcript_39317:463-789(-)
MYQSYCTPCGNAERNGSLYPNLPLALHRLPPTHPGVLRYHLHFSSFPFLWAAACREATADANSLCSLTPSSSPSTVFCDLKLKRLRFGSDWGLRASRKAERPSMLIRL